MRTIRAFLDRLFSHETMDGDGLCPVYLHRWTLLKVGSLFSVYLHKFVGDDWSLDLHDHPKRFWSIGLRGWYYEHTPESGIDDDGRFYRGRVRRFNAPWIRTFPAEHIHRLTGPTPEHPCWTLVIVGRAVRPWGFWHFGQFVPWRRYVNSDAAKETRSCP